MKKKLFTLLTLALAVCSGAWAADVYKISFNGKNEEFKNGESVTAGTYFSWNSSKHNFNTKFNGCTYDGVSYTSGLKMEGDTKVSWTSTAEATVTIVQSKWSENTIKLDGTALELASAESITGGYVHTITDVAAGSHSVTRGSGENGIFAIIVEYTGTVLTQLTAPSITFDATSGEVTIGAVTNATKVTYTTDGSDPPSESTEYTAPFTAADGTVVKAIAIGDQTAYSNSDVASETVLLETATIETPVINQFNGTVAITCATINTTIKYSIDGGATYQDYTRAFTLSADAEVKAKAIRGSKESEVATAAVTVVPANPATTKTILMGFGSFTVDSNKKYIMTGNAGDAAEGYTLTIDNTGKSWSELTNTKLTMTQNGNVERTAIKLSNGAKNILTLPTGVKATRITIYSVINSGYSETARTCYWKEFNGENIDGSNVPMGAWNDVTDRTTNPDVRVFPLTGEETEITFTNAGEQLGFVIALDVIEAPVAITPTYAKTTYVTTKVLDFSSVEGLKAYVATAASAGKVTLSEVAAVPAGTPLMLIGTANTEYTVPVTATATAPATNMFRAGDDGTTVFDGSTFDYILYSDGLFYQIGSGTVASTKAYLHCETDPTTSGSRSLAISFGNETTGISNVNANVKENSYYDLQGRSVAQPQKGLYIVNGKKVIIK